MLELLDRCRRDSTLLQFNTKRLRYFIDPDHLLIQIDERLDFAKLVALLEARYSPDFGRPAIHPEVMVRALLICSLYNIASFRRLCSAISENICYRWFCFLTIDDPVFDHSIITCFINRIGREGFSEVFDGLNQELLRMGLLSPEMYADWPSLRYIRFIGSSGLGPVPVAQVVEGRLRGIHGGSGPQRAEAGTHIEPRCRTTWPGAARTCRQHGTKGC